MRVSNFQVPRAQWAALVQRSEHLVGGQADWLAGDLDAQWEEAAQRCAAHLIRARASVVEERCAQGPDYHGVDLDSLELLHPRSVAIEHGALAALGQVALDKKLAALGFNGRQQAIYDALGITDRPGRTEKTAVSHPPTNRVVPERQSSTLQLIALTKNLWPACQTGVRRSTNRLLH